MPFGLKQVLIAITFPLNLEVGASWVVFPSHRNNVNVVVVTESLTAFCGS